MLYSPNDTHGGALAGRDLRCLSWLRRASGQPLRSRNRLGGDGQHNGRAAENAGTEPENVAPLTCKEAPDATLPRAFSPFQELRLVDLSADRVQQQVLVARIADSWHWVVTMEGSYEENRGGGDGRVEELFFQDIVPGGGAELVMRVENNTWYMDHDDDSTIGSGTTSLMICHSKAPGKLACADVPYGEQSDGDGESDEAYRFALKVAVDTKGRVHVTDPRSADPRAQPSELAGVFELSF